MDNLTSKVGFIPTYESLPDANDFEEGKIIIDFSQAKPRLKYSKVEGEKMVWVTVDGSDSPNIPASMSELDSQLRERDWNICGRLYSNIEYTKPSVVITSTTSTPGLLPVPDKTTTSIPEDNYTTTAPETENPDSEFSLRRNISVVSSIEDQQSESEEEKLYLSRVLENLPEIPSIEDLSQNSVCLTDDDYSISEDSGFCSIYEELINLKMKELALESGGTEIIDLGTRHYFDIVSLRDVERGSSIIDLIALGGSNYTNTVNLNGLIESSLSKFINSSCYLVAGIEYTVSGKTYTKEYTFVPFRSESGEVISESLIINLSDYVILDYHFNCLRAFPNSKDVTECIISYCYLTYEGLF